MTNLNTNSIEKVPENSAGIGEVSSSSKKSALFYFGAIAITAAVVYFVKYKAEDYFNV